MTIKIMVDVRTMGDLITVDEWLAFQDGDYKASVEVLSRFVIGDDGKPLTPESGRKLVGKLTLSEWSQIRSEMRVAANEAAVPNESGSS